MKGWLGRRLRSAVYGIEDLDLSLTERIRWDLAAIAVLVAGSLSAIGMGHLMFLATDSLSWALTLGVPCLLLVIAFDRAITKPEPDFTGLPVGSGPPLPEAPSKYATLIRLPLSLVTIILGGLGLGLLINHSQVEAEVDRTIQSSQLERMQDKTATYYGTLVATRNASVGQVCRILAGPEESRGYANFAEARVRTINEDAIAPAIGLFSGSHALDLVVDGTDPQVRASNEAGNPTCDRGKALLGQDPLTPLWRQSLTAAAASSVAPDLLDVRSYQKAVTAAFNSAKRAEGIAAGKLDEGTGLQRLAADGSYQRTVQRRETLERLQMFTGRWSAGLEAQLDEPDLGRRIGAIWSSGLLVVLGSMAAVLFFDLVPFFAAFFFRPPAGRETLDQRLASRELEDRSFRAKTLQARLEAIANLKPGPTTAKAVNAEFEDVAGSFDGSDVPPRRVRRHPIRATRPPAPPQQPDSGRRRFATGLAVTTIGVAGAGSIAARWAAALAIAEPLGGYKLMYELVESFGLGVALEAIERVTGFSPDAVVDAVMGPEVPPSKLSDEYRPADQPPSIYATPSGGAFLGIGTPAGTTIYPGFVSPEAFQAPTVSIDDTLLLGPHWLSVLAQAGNQLLDYRPVGGPLAGQVLLPQQWSGGDTAVVRGRTTRHQVVGEWSSNLARINVNLTIDGGTKPTARELSTGPQLTQVTARGTVTIEHVVLGVSRSTLDQLEAYVPPTIEVADIPVPVLWTA